LIYDAHAFQDFANLPTHISFSEIEIQSFIEKAVSIKSYFVTQDPLDKGIRKALNFGHTMGHAIESYFLTTSTPLLHGEAVAMGIITESFISFHKGKLNGVELNTIVKTLQKRLLLSPISSEAFETIYLLSLHDKKNTSTINCVLLNGIGHFELNEPINKDEILLSLTYYNSSCELYAAQSK